MYNFFSWLTGLFKKQPTVPDKVEPRVVPVPISVPINISDDKTDLIDKPLAKTKKILIGISPGHCPNSDSGAVSPTGQKEAILARKVSVLLYKCLQRNKTFDPFLYGMNEAVKDYPGRVKNSDLRKDDFYLPVHFNASTNYNINGFLVFVDPSDLEKHPKLKDLCLSILGELQTAFPIGFVDYDGNKKDGFMAGIERKIFELYKPLANTVYLELGFLSNPAWDKIVADEKNLDMLAQSIAKGFEKFFVVGADT